MGKAVFSGGLVECLRHYGENLVRQAPGGTKGATESRRPLAEFVGSTVRTVERWFRPTDRMKPVGIYLVKAMYFLEKEGYEVRELKRLSPEIHRLGALIAFDKEDAEEVSKELGYTQISNFYRVLRGDQLRVLDVTMEKIKQILVRHQSGEAPGVSTPASPAGRKIISGGEMRAPGAPIESPRTKHPRTDKEALIRALVSAVGLIIPLAEQAASERFSVADREMIHRLAGEGRVHYAVVILSRLCSETALETP